MPKYDYEDLRDEVERWTASEADVLERREKAQLSAHDDDPEGHYLDTIGDTAGQYFRSSLSKKDELLGLIVFAEAAERQGDVAKADRLVAEIHDSLAQRSGVSAMTGFSLESEFDPEPPEVPNISLLDQAEHDYEALLRAVERWQDAEERDVGRWENEPDNDRDPANHFADTTGEGSAIHFGQIQSQAEDLRTQIRQAAACEKRGDMAEADRLVAGVRDAIGITDDAVLQIEAFLYEAARKSASRRRVLGMIWALVVLAAIAAALFTALG